MSRATRRLRAGLVAATAVGLVGSVFGISPAGAVSTLDPAGTPTLVALSEPDVYRSETSPAGNLRLASDVPGDVLTVVNGEQIIFEVDDSNGQNCVGLSSAQFIGFAVEPTVTANLSPGVEIDASLRSSSVNPAAPPVTGTPCDTFLPAVQDQLVVTVTQAPVAGGTIGSIVVSGITYAVGSLADTGEVQVTAVADVDPALGYQAAAGESNPITGSDASNAYVTNLAVTVGPAIAIQPGAGRAAPTVTLRETTPDAFTPAGATGAVCITLVSPDRVDFVGAGTAAVSPAAPAGDTVNGIDILDGGNTLRVRVTDNAASVESTITLSGILVNTQAGNFGQQHFEVHQCDPTPGATTSTLLPTVPAGEQPITPAADPADVTAYTNPDNDPILVVVVRARRYGGLDRFETAQSISESAFSDCSDFAVIARGDDFPDALAGNYVAGTLYAPILLTNTDSIPSATLDSLRAMGVTDVVIMGGVNAVSQAVADQLDANLSYECGGGSIRRTPEDQPRTLNYVRVGGPDRFSTARLAATFDDTADIGTLLPTDNTDNELRTALLANGLNFPDALAGGPLAWQGCNDHQHLDCGNGGGFPLLLSNGQSSTLPTATESALSQEDIQQVIILGGTAAVPQSIETLLTSRGIRVIRLAGATRQETAVKIAQFVHDDPKGGRLQFGNDGEWGVALARGDVFADALTMGPLAGLFQIPLLLTEGPSSLGSATAGQLAVEGSHGVYEIHIAGGVSAISTAVENAALAALGGV